MMTGPLAALAEGEALAEIGDARPRFLVPIMAKLAKRAAWEAAYMNHQRLAQAVAKAGG